jgi:hypothetical protein
VHLAGDLAWAKTARGSAAWRLRHLLVFADYLPRALARHPDAILALATACWACR